MTAAGDVRPAAAGPIIGGAARVSPVTRAVMQSEPSPNLPHLIARARAGDEAALRWLYEAHRPRVHRLAVGLLGDGDEADDIVQDVMIYALGHLDRYDPDRAAFTTWLHTIAVSRCRDRGRRARRRLGGLRAWWSAFGEPSADPEAGLDRIDAQGALGQALGSLTPLQREALALRVVAELSFQEIGDALGIPLRTAQTRVTGAVAALRRAMAPGAAGRPSPGGRAGRSPNAGAPSTSGDVSFAAGPAADPPTQAGRR